MITISAAINNKLLKNFYYILPCIPLKKKTVLHRRQHFKIINIQQMHIRAKAFSIHTYAHNSQRVLYDDRFCLER